MAKTEYVLWDWNGTLLNDVRQNLSVFRTMLQNRGLDGDVSEKFYRENFGFPVLNFYKMCGFDFTGESFTAVADEYMTLYNENFDKNSLFQNTLSTLTALRENGIKQVILSASEKMALDRQVAFFSLTEFFEAILGVTDALGNGKTGIGSKWMEENGISPEKVVMIGDTDHDFEVAKALGCGCILISAGHQCEERLRRTGAAVTDDIGKIPGMLL